MLLFPKIGSRGFMLLFSVFLMSIAGDFFIPQDLLDEYGFSTITYGYARKHHVYLANRHHMVRVDFDGNLKAEFSARGAGPEELVSGGPLFTFGDKVWCHDIMGRRLVVFDDDLNLLYARKFPKQSQSAAHAVAPGATHIFAVDYPSIGALGKPLRVAAYNPETLALERSFTVDGWQAAHDKAGFFRIDQLQENSFALYETIQNEEYYRVFLWNADTGGVRSIQHLTPSRATAKTSKMGAFGLLFEGATAIKGVVRGSSEDWVYLNTRGSESRKKSTRDVERFHIHRFNTATGKAKQARIEPFYMVQSPGITQGVMLHDPEKGLTIQLLATTRD